jgi:hypothetical protein
MHLGKAGKSKKHFAASQKALEAAELSLKGEGHVTALAKRLNVGRATTTQARIILEFGSEQDIADARSGAKGLRPLADEIRKTFSEETKEKLRKRTGGALSPNHKSLLRTDQALWAKLGAALRNLSELPKPKELIHVVRHNGTRILTVRQRLLNAANWIEEFNNEWKRSEEGTSNTGGGSEAA